MPINPTLVGGIISGLGGLFKKARNPYGDVFNATAAKIEAGKRYGLSNLAASGISSPYSGASFNPAPDFSALGDAIARSGSNSQAQALNEKQNALLDAQIAESRSRTILNQANAHRPLVGPTSPDDPYAMRRENALIEVQLEDGTVITMPNPELYETGPTELATGRAVIEGARAVHEGRQREIRNTPDFPSNPVLGQLYRKGDYEWQYRRTGWMRRNRTDRRIQ